MSDPSIHRRMASNRNKISKFFPDEFLPEELSGIKMCQSVPWCWTDESSQRSAGSSQRSAGSRQRAAGSGQRAAVSRQRLADSNLWAELYELEVRAANLLAEKSEEELADVADELDDWLKSYVCTEGVLSLYPWQTQAILPPLCRLRQALTKLEWTKELEESFRGVVGAIFRTHTGSRSLFGEPGQPSKQYRKLLGRLSQETGLRAWNDIPRCLWEKPSERQRQKSPTPGMQSDEAGIAVLRQEWSRHAGVLGIDSQDTTCLVQLQLLDRLVLDGPWNVTIRVSDKKIPLDGQWAATCWFTDQDGEYLELRLDLGSGLVLDRQLYLPRRTQILWLSDTLGSSTEKALELRWQLPTAGATGLLGLVPTRAQALQGYDFDLRTIPIGLPANPMETSQGRISFVDGRLTLSTRAETKRLFLPLVLAWDKKTLPTQQAWRQLTITNDRRRVDSSEAVAFRLPLRNTQFVFFRALHHCRRYAFLGHQTLNECVIGKIDSDGELQSWLMVE